MTDTQNPDPWTTDIPVSPEGEPMVPKADLHAALAQARGEVLLRLDDVDGLANAMNQADGAAQNRISPSWDALSLTGKAYYRAQAETVKGYLLGGEIDPQNFQVFRRLWDEDRR